MDCLYTSVSIVTYTDGLDFKYILVEFLLSLGEKRHAHQEPIQGLGQGCIDNQMKGRTVGSLQMVSNATRRAPNFDPFLFPVLRKKSCHYLFVHSHAILIVEHRTIYIQGRNLLYFLFIISRYIEHCPPRNVLVIG